MKLKDKNELDAMLTEIATSMGIEMVECVFKQGKDPSLTVYIDKEGGVDLDTCEAYHNAIDLPLDEYDYTLGAPYTLNVSSLGLDRPFKTDRDYMRNLGEEVEFKLYAPRKGVKNFEGKLLGYEKGLAEIELSSGEVVKFNTTEIAKITKLIKF